MAMPICKNRRGLLCRFLILQAACMAARAEPVVIHDSGRTRPMAEYLFQPDPRTAAKLKRRPAIPDRASLRMHVFPVTTPEMTPGDVMPRAVNLPQLSYPVFLIGSDRRSQNWLTMYRGRLKEIGAIGMLVEVRDEREYRRIQAIAAGIELVPASGTELAKQLRVQHYPLLIGREWIEQ